MRSKNENWIRAYWRPAMAWLYFGICFCDFILFPILFQLAQFYLHQNISAYVPITLTNGGLMHTSFGAIISINAYSRGKEILEKQKQANESTNG